MFLQITKCHFPLFQQLLSGFVYHTLAKTVPFESLNHGEVAIPGDAREREAKILRNSILLTIGYDSHGHEMTNYD